MSMKPRDVTSPTVIREEMNIDEREIDRRKGFLELDTADNRRLEDLNPLAEANADQIIESLYTHFFAFDETRGFFRDPKVLEYVKRMQREYFIRLTRGTYDMTYIEHRLKIGAVHASINLDVKWYLGAYNFYLRQVGSLIMDNAVDDPQEAFARFLALTKLVFLDIGLAIDTYIYQRESTIREQQEAIRELSTPVLQVRPGLLILPIIGVIDADRARQLTEQLLRAIRSSRSKVVVVDITGVPAVDSGVANHLIQTVEASRLMGATVIVTGLSAVVAQTLVTLGVDLTKLNTVGDLQGGIEEAERLLGYRVVTLGADGAGLAQ